jgi:hypothetical protein
MSLIRRILSAPYCEFCRKVIWDKEDEVNVDGVMFHRGCAPVPWRMPKDKKVMPS